MASGIGSFGSGLYVMDRLSAAGESVSFCRACKMLASSGIVERMPAGASEDQGLAGTSPARAAARLISEANGSIVTARSKILCATPRQF